MKPGTGDDPFADEPTDGDIDESEGADDEQSEPNESTTSGLSPPRDESNSFDDPTLDEGQSPSALPYLARRQLKNKSVKADREQVLFFLREEIQASEREFRRRVQEELDQEVHKTNLREAAYVFALRNPDAVADVLREWGIEYLT